MIFSHRLALFAAPFSALFAALPAYAHDIGDRGAHFHEAETTLNVFGMAGTTTLLMALVLGLGAGALFALFRRASPLKPKGPQNDPQNDPQNGS